MGLIGIASCSSDPYVTKQDGEYYLVEENQQDNYVAPTDYNMAYDEEVDYFAKESSIFNTENVNANDSALLRKYPDEAAKIFNKRVPPLNSLIVCRDKQCAPAEIASSKEYIFNSLVQLIDNNLDTKALLCEANPQAHVCTNPYLTISAKVGVTPAYVFFDSVKIVDASVVDGHPALNLALNYNMSYNGQTPYVCKPDRAMLYVKNNNSIVLNGNGFNCDMTSVGTTVVRVMFNVDYIDIDYGYIGGYYSIGLSGPANGGGSGYALIRLAENAYPLKPVLDAPADELANESGDKNKSDTKTESVKLNVNEKALDLKDEVKKEEDSVNVVTPSDEVSKEVIAEVSEAVKDVAEESTPEEVSFEFKSSEISENIHSAQPHGMTENSVVTADKVILAPENTDVKPLEVKSISLWPSFEETEASELDEYIK